MKTVIVDFNNQAKAYEEAPEFAELADAVVYFINMTDAAKEVDNNNKINMGRYPSMFSASMNIIPAINAMAAAIQIITEDPSECFGEFTALVREKLNQNELKDSRIIQAIKVAVELNKLITKEEE